MGSRLHSLIWRAGAIGLTIAVVLVTVAVDVAAQHWTPGRVDTSAVLQGTWESCREADGEYAERIVDLRPPGTPAVEFHLGPSHDFALFRGIQDAHRDHASSENLLAPHIVGHAGEQMARHTWRALGYTIDVVLAGGSYDDCESWVVTVTR